MDTSFGKRLKEVREKQGMTQEKLARAADLSLSTVAKLEHSPQDPSWSTVQALAKALGVDCTAFTEKVEAKPQAEEKPARKSKSK